jgi:uncharacterized damage-inducible protein DinB
MKNFCSYALVFSLVLTAGATGAFGQAAPANAMSSANTTMSMSPMGSFDYKAKFQTDMKDLQSKFVSLAQAFPQDKYTWRPGEGVRSVSEVFLHVAGGNFSIPGMMGATPPTSFTRNGYETSTTDKAAVIAQLKQSFDYINSTVAGMSTADMTKVRQGRGGSASTAYDTLFLITIDLHEHLGQIIAYARVNNVVPPWTAERQASRGATATPPAKPNN